MFIGVQVTAARGLLGISKKELAKESGISFSTIRRIEEDKKGTHGQAEIIKTLEKFFISKGIIFMEENKKVFVGIEEKNIK